MESVYFGRPQGINFDKVLRVVALVADRTQTSFDLLIKKPFEQMKESNIDISFEVFSYSEIESIRLDEVDILYVFRIYADPVPELVAQAKERGIRVIFESDDNYFALKFDNGSPVHGDFKNPPLEEILLRANHVIVYSDAMEVDARNFSNKVSRLRPYQLTPMSSSTKTFEDVIGFMGSLKKDVDFECVVPAVQRLLAERPALRVEFFGFVPAALEGNHRVSVQSFDPNYDDFIQKFRERGWSVGLAPLADTVFNRSKTNNKFREYAAAGYAGVYSNIPPYEDCVIDHVTGLLVENDTKSWYDAIKTLLENNGLRSSIAANAFRDVKRQYRFDDHVAAKLEILREVARPEGVVTGKAIIESSIGLRPENAPERNWKSPKKFMSRQVAIDVAVIPFTTLNIGNYTGQLCAVEIVVSDFVASADSVLGIEIVYENEIIDQVARPLQGIQRDSVVRFDLHRPILVDRNIEVRVFGRSVFGAIKILGRASFPRYRSRPSLFLVGRKV